MQLSCKYFSVIILVVNFRLPQLWANAKPVTAITIQKAIADFTLDG
jgi:hypothetical protein